MMSWVTLMGLVSPALLSGNSTVANAVDGPTSSRYMVPLKALTVAPMEPSDVTLALIDMVIWLACGLLTIIPSTLSVDSSSLRWAILGMATKMLPEQG